MRITHNQKGFSAVEAIIILVIVAAIGLGGWYVWQKQSADAPKTNATQQQKKSTGSDSAEQATPDPTADWTAYSSAAGVFSLKYPSSWVQPINKDTCSPGLFDRSLYVAPDAQSALLCGSEFFGQMWIGSVAGDKQADFELSTNDYKEIVTKNVTVNGVQGKRISGVAKAKSDDDVFAPLEGTTEVHYIFFTNGTTYSARYTQAPQGHTPSTDVLKDFDLVITKTLKFSS